MQAKDAARQRKTLSDTLRDAIALSKWFQDTHDAGGRILVERDRKVREILKL